jgi:hypothetical protein
MKKALIIIALLLIVGGLYMYDGNTKAASLPDIKVTSEYVYDLDYTMAGDLKEIKGILNDRGKNGWELVVVSSTKYTTTLYWKKAVIKIN